MRSDLASPIPSEPPGPPPDDMRDPAFLPPPTPTLLTPAISSPVPRQPTTEFDPRCNPDLSRGGYNDAYEDAYNAVFAADGGGAQYAAAPSPAAHQQLQKQQSTNDFWGACEGSLPKEGGLRAASPP